MSKLKIIFAGTPPFAAINLQALLNSEHEICAVYTQPDRPAGRGQKLMPSAVKTLAVQANIPVHQPLSLKSEAEQAILQAYQADVMIVVAYGLILPAAVLALPKFGCLNIHASLLPRWRGAAPIQRAILAGDGQTGISIMQMDAGLDTGPVLQTLSCDIAATETSATLHDKLAPLGAQALQTVLENLVNYPLTPQVQNNALATYAHKLTKAEANINWLQSANEIDRAIRAYQPWPVAYTHLDDKVLRIWQAEPLNKSFSVTPGTIVEIDKHSVTVACGKGALRLLSIQWPNAKQQTVAQALTSQHQVWKLGKIIGK